MAQQRSCWRRPNRNCRRLPLAGMERNSDDHFAFRKQLAAVKDRWSQGFDDCVAGAVRLFLKAYRADERAHASVITLTGIVLDLKPALLQNAKRLVQVSECRVRRRAF